MILSGPLVPFVFHLLGMRHVVSHMEQPGLVDPICLGRCHLRNVVTRCMICLSLANGWTDTRPLDGTKARSCICHTKRTKCCTTVGTQITLERITFLELIRVIHCDLHRGYLPGDHVVRVGGIKISRPNPNSLSKSTQLYVKYSRLQTENRDQGFDC